MVAKSFPIFFLLCGIVAVMQTAPTCPENEELKDMGIDCQTCKNYALVFCQTSNERKCYCKGGYVRDDDNNYKCVQTRNCTFNHFNFN
ncbi:unnamed protein product [Tenebrio molitor]|nr:unnamed protein product [Tenebrio molitor]